MGSLVLPTSGRVYVDANTIIYRVERVEPYLSRTALLWDSLRNRQIDVCTSELSFLEVVVKPLRLQDDMLYGLFQRILYDVIGFATLPISLAILARAAQLRASTSLKTPDAIHAATALEAGCMPKPISSITRRCTMPPGARCHAPIPVLRSLAPRTSR